MPIRITRVRGLPSSVVIREEREITLFIEVRSTESERGIWTVNFACDYSIFLQQRYSVEEIAPINPGFTSLQYPTLVWFPEPMRYTVMVSMHNSVPPPPNVSFFLTGVVP